MDFYSRGRATTSHLREDVFSHIQESCKYLKASISEIDEQSYSITGRSSSNWKTFGDQYTITLKKENSNTLIEIYYNRIGLHGPYKDFIESFFKTLARHIPLQSGIQYDTVNIKQTALVTNILSNDQFPKLIIPWQQVLIYNFDAKILSFTDTMNEEIDSLTLYPIELGNRLEFKNKKENKTFLVIPIRDISKIESFSEETGSFRKKNEFVIAVEFRDHDDIKSIKFEIEEKHIGFLIEQVNKLRELDKQDYYQSANLQYLTESNNLQDTEVQFKSLVLASGEDVLWSNLFGLHKVKGAVTRVHALTNFRVIDYDLQTHNCGRIFLRDVDDVIVMNQNRRSHSERIGAFTGSGFRYGFSGTTVGTSKGISETIGDVVFMKDGIPYITFAQISDPSGLARLAKTVKKQLFVEKKFVKIQQTGIKSTCSKCGNLNPSDSSFCNKCGSILE